MMLESYVDCKIVVAWLKHLLHAVDKAVELRVGIHIKEVSSGQLGGHIGD